MINIQSTDIELATGYEEDLRFPAGLTGRGSANPPNWVAMVGSYAGLFILEFDNVIEEDVQIFAQMPHGWQFGSRITPHIHWANHRDGVGTVRFGMTYSIADINGYFATPLTTIYTEQVADPLVAGEVKHQLAELAPIDMTGYTYSAMLMIRMFRDCTHVNDTLTTDAGFLEFDIHYLNEKFGYTS